MTANVSMPKKNSASTFILYGILALFIILACWVLGAAMDLSVNASGKVDISALTEGINRVLSDTSLLMTALKRDGGYAPKMIFLGTTGSAIFLLYRYTGTKKRLHRAGVEHGSAKWGDQKEIKSLADHAPAQLKPLLTAEGKRVFDEKGNFECAKIDNNIILTKEVKLSLNPWKHLLNLNVLVIGGSGSGKTRFYAEPNIMQLNTSYVITDPKGEILRSTGKMLQNSGYKLKVFNLIQMEHSNNYNPFHYVYDQNGELSEDNVVKMINVLFKNMKGDGEKEDFWSQKGQTMLEAIVFLLFEESEYNAQFDDSGKIIAGTRDLSHLNFFSVAEKMRRLQYPPRSSQSPDGFFLERNPDESEEAFRERQSQAFLCPLDKDFLELQRRKGDTLAMRLYKEVRNAPEETGQSFLSSANVKTFMFNLENIKNLTCCDTIELETIGDEKTALFVIISATDSTYNFMAAMMYTQMFDILSNRANFKYGGKLPVHVRCILDEFATIGEIPNFDKVIAFVRSMDMSVNVIIQNLAQLKSRYEKKWEDITGNCDSLLFLGGKEESTLKSISELLGKETIDVKGHNRTKGGKQSSTSENNSILGRELMQPNELSVMPITDCVLIVRSHNPFYCTKYPLEKHPNYKLLANYDAKNAFKVTSLHSISFSGLTETSKKVDTCINFSQPSDDDAIQVEQIDAIFQRLPAPEVTMMPHELEYESYTDIALYEDMVSTEEISEKYADNSPKFGIPSELEYFELGEARNTEARREVEEDASDIRDPLIEGTEPEQRYAVPDEYAEQINDIAEIASHACTDATEFFCEAIQGVFDEIEDIDDYAMDFA